MRNVAIWKGRSSPVIEAPADQETLTQRYTERAVALSAAVRPSQVSPAPSGSMS